MLIRTTGRRFEVETGRFIFGSGFWPKAPLIGEVYHYEVQGWIWSRPSAGGSRPQEVK